MNDSQESQSQPEDLTMEAKTEAMKFAVSAAGVYLSEDDIENIRIGRHLRLKMRYGDDY